MNYNDWKQMQKHANFFTWVGKGIGGMADIGTNTAVMLLAAGAGVGGAAGWLAAKMNAHDKQDIDTIQKEYENERLKADIGYVASRLEDEYNRSKTAVKPKAARVLNV